MADLHSRFIANVTLDKLNDLSSIPCMHTVYCKMTARLMLDKYSFAATGRCTLKLRGEIALERRKTVRLKNESNFVPETAVAALQACDKTTFPLIHTFLSILVTLPVSTTSAERSFSMHSTACQDVARSRVTEDRPTRLALLNVHRDLLFDIDKVIDRFAKGKHRSMEFII